MNLSVDNYDLFAPCDVSHHDVPTVVSSFSVIDQCDSIVRIDMIYRPIMESGKNTILIQAYIGTMRLYSTVRTYEHMIMPS